jgi:Tol biopolymer transport system component
VNDQQLSTLFTESDLTGQPPLPPGYLPDLMKAGRRSVRRRRIATILSAAAMVVVLLGLAGLIRPQATGLRPAGGVSGSPTLPDRIAAYSSFTGEVSAAPPGRAIMIYRYGSGETLEVWQALALSADGDAYRQIDAAGGRGGRHQWLLSPDGGSVILAEGQRAASVLTIVDLATGKHHDVKLPQTTGVTLLAISPDGRYVAYAFAPPPDDLRAGNAIEYETARVGTMAILDLTTGQSIPVPGLRPVQAAAFAQDGSRLVVQSALQTWIVTLDGRRERQVALPSGTGIVPRNAWSPDGRTLATTTWRADSWQLLDGSTTSAYVVDADVKFGVYDITKNGGLPRPISDDAMFLGWRSGDHVLVLTPSPTDSGGEELTDVSITDGTKTVLSRFDTGRTCELGMQTCQVSQIAVAADLLQAMTVRPAGVPDRGPWPSSMRLLVGAPCVLVAGLAALVVYRLRRRRRRGSPNTEPTDALR